MKLYHTSPIAIEDIYRGGGVFNDCLFFAQEPYVMTQATTIYTYSILIDEEKIIHVGELYDETVIAEIMETVDIDAQAAERLLDDRDSVYDYGKCGEVDWWIQAQQGKAAKLMGYEACVARDEQGTVYIIPMYGRAADLHLEELEVMA